MFKGKDGTMQRMVLDICFILIIIRGYNMIDIIIINTKTNRISEKKAEYKSLEHGLFSLRINTQNTTFAFLQILVLQDVHRWCFIQIYQISHG